MCQRTAASIISRRLGRFEMKSLLALCLKTELGNVRIRGEWPLGRAYVREWSCPYQTVTLASVDMPWFPTDFCVAGDYCCRLV